MKILKRAQNLVAQYGTSDAATIMASIGIEIAYIPMSNLRGIYNCIEKMPFVAINSNLTDCERKFVEAHELAHYILPVSYTHLDVYKRQERMLSGMASPCARSTT